MFERLTKQPNEGSWHSRSKFAHLEPKMNGVSKYMKSVYTACRILNAISDILENFSLSDAQKTARIKHLIHLV